MRDRTRITELTAPAQANAGDSVPVTMTIENKWSASVYVAAIAVRDTTDRFISWEKVDIPVGQSQQFAGSFIMPNGFAIVHAYSYYWGEDEAWHLDDEVEIGVSLGTGQLDVTAMIGLVVVVVMIGMVMGSIRG